MTLRELRLAGVLILFPFAVATAIHAQEPAYLSSMPTPERVIAITRGANSFDSTARLSATFDRLYEITEKLIGDRYTAGQMTPRERTVRDTYQGNRDRIMRELKASLPPDQREFQPHTRFKEWRRLVDEKYWPDPKFHEQLLAAYFSPSFRAKYASALTLPAAARVNRTSPAEGGSSSGESPLHSGPSFFIVLGAATLAAAILTRVLMRKRLELDPKDPFRVHLGRGTFKLWHYTGSAEGVTKMGTTNVYGGGGGGYVNPGGRGYIAPVTVSSSTTIHDQFFIRSRDGKVEPIQLKNWDVPVGEGHVLSAVYGKPEDSESGVCFMLTNHTTNLRYFSPSFLKAGKQARNGPLVLLLDVVLCALVFYFAPPAWSRFAIVAGTLLGMVIASHMWQDKMSEVFMPRFKKEGLRPLFAQLDAAAEPAAVR